MNELKEAFGNNRDYHFRQRVHELQNEMALISNAQVYEDWPISDSPEDVAKQLTQLAASGQITSDTPISGRWYSNFVQEINRSKEERDAELAVMMVSSGTFCDWKVLFLSLTGCFIKRGFPFSDVL